VTVTTDQLSGWFKRKYADKLERAVPDFAILRKEIPFKQQEKLGETYNFPVKLTRSHGITWNGGATAGTAFALNAAITFVTKNAQLSGSEFMMREQIAYGAIARSGTGEDASYGPVMDEVPLEMNEASNFYLEMALLYGGMSIGTIESQSGSGTTRAFVITKATWAAGLWAQMEGASLDGWTLTSEVPSGTIVNTNAQILVTTIDPDTRTINTSGNATDLDAMVAGKAFVPRGAKGNWFEGITRIASNTGSLFNIDAATYNLWKGNTHAVNSVAMTLTIAQRGITRAVVRGLMEKVTLLMSTYTWTDVNNDLAALRRYAESTKQGLDIGTEKITFYGANGQMELMAHPMLKAGEALAVPLKHFKRVGSSDITFKLPGMPEGQFFRHLTDNAGCELRCYFDQAVVCTKPARTVRFTGIVNDSL